MDKAIKQIETANINLNLKGQLVLLYAGERPVISETIYGKIKTRKQGKPIFKTSPDEERKISGLLENLGLYYRWPNKTIMKTPDELFNDNGEKEYPYKESLDVIALYEEEKLNKLIGAENKNDHWKIGELLGYPKTAIEAFTELRERAYPGNEFYENPALGEIGKFIFSKSNYQQEINTAIKWQETIKQKSPKIYNQMEKKALEDRAKKQKDLFHSKRKT